MVKGCGLASLAMLGLLLATAMPAGAGNMYKCKGAGKFDPPVWTDTPCRPGSELRQVVAKDYSQEDNATEGHGKFTAIEVSSLIRFRKVVVGMSKQDVIRSWGLPDKINSTWGSSGKTDQMVYGLNSTDTKFVYIDEAGLVSSIQGKPDEVVK